ncbi:OmpA family protein [Palleronia rufa]
MMRAVLLALAMATGAPLWAGEVRLLKDGTTVATGERLGFDGRYYRLLGPYGEVTLDGAALICEGDCGAVVPRIRISGEGGVVAAILPPLLETYARRRRYDLSISVDEGRDIYAFARDGDAVGEIALSPTSSAEGMADLIADAADLAVSLRPVTVPERDMARLAGRGDLTQPGRIAILALDALVPVVRLGSDRTTITLPDLRAAAEGAGALHLPARDTGAGEALAARLPWFYPATGGMAVEHDDPAAVAAAVADTPGALGVTLFSALGDAQALALTGPCGAVAAARVATIKAEDYPLTLPVFLYAPARRLTGIGRDFVDYATSPAAQPVIRRAGLIDQFPEAIPFAGQGDRLGRAILAAGPEVPLDRLRAMVSDLIGLTRLSLSFRFENGSTRLDAQSAANVSLLAEALERGLFDGRRLLFAGFSDGDGPASGNRSLSVRRARAVRDAVAEAVPAPDVRLDAAGYGEALPMACDETLWGQRVNRRVEVWLD